MPAFSRRRLTLSYAVALLAIALLSIASHSILERMLAEHMGSAAVVNISGRQRMLSQRIAGLAAQYQLGVPTARGDLAASVDEFEDNHRLLIAGDPGRHLPPANTPALKAIYFEGRPTLDSMIRDYTAHARRVLAMTPDNAAMSAEITALALAARKPLLTGLNAVVTEHVVESERQLGKLEALQNIVLAVVLMTLLVEALAIFRPMVNRIADYSKELLRLASTDALTGVLNRRSFQERSAAEFSRAQRHDEPVSILMIDADNFKQINDKYGHGGGDAVLVALAAALGRAARGNDLVGRLGGEEFGILLPVTDLSAAISVAERVRREIAALKVPYRGVEITLTVSIGASEVEAGASSLESTSDRADTALYLAKAGGRNRVNAAPAPTATVPIPVTRRLEAAPARTSGTLPAWS